MKFPPKITLRAARANAEYSEKEVAAIVSKHYQTILEYEKDREGIPRNLLIELSEVNRY